MKCKVIYSDNGTLSDFSAHLSGYYGGSNAFTWDSANDALYIGSQYPFTSKYFIQTVANAVAATPSISYWDGVNWRSMSNVMDQTGLAGTPFANSGYLEFMTDKRYHWIKDDTTVNGSENITDLGDVTFYDMYWVKITYSANISMTLSWVGEMFCTDDDIGGLFPHLVDSTFIDDWESGKTTWEEQRIIATESVVQHLRNIHLNSPNLLLDKAELSLATAYWTVGMIYQAMGSGLREASDEAFVEAKNLLKNLKLTKDLNHNGREDPGERQIRVTRLTR